MYSVLELAKTLSPVTPCDSTHFPPVVVINFHSRNFPELSQSLTCKSLDQTFDSLVSLCSLHRPYIRALLPLAFPSFFFSVLGY
jgi:hypothetical protein